MKWITHFEKLFDSRHDDKTEAVLKQEYINWLNERGSYYASLATTVPEFIELLNVIERAIGVKVKIEEPKEEEK